MANEWDARIVLAKSAEKRKLLSESGIYILPALSIEDAKKENLCLKKRRQLHNHGELSENLKIRNFELF